MAGIKKITLLLLLLCAGSATAQQTTSHYISLGNISEDGGVVRGVYEFINNTGKPIVFTRSAVDCGCIKVETPLKPTPEGEKVVLEYSYNPKGYPGRVSRKALIYAVGGDVLKLEFNGFVRSSSIMTTRFPHMMGEALLKQSSVSFSGQPSRQVERIAAYNDSNKRLSISAQNGTVPEGVTLRTEPAHVEAKSNFDIVVSYDPAMFKREKNDFKLIMDGLTAAPSTRAIEVRFNK